MQKKNEIYAKPDFDENDGIEAAKLEEKFEIGKNLGIGKKMEMSKKMKIVENRNSEKIENQKKN